MSTKAKKSTTPVMSTKAKSGTTRWDSSPSTVTGQSLHVKPMESAGLYVGISYPVNMGGHRTLREIVVVLTEAERGELAGFLARLAAEGSDKA